MSDAEKVKQIQERIKSFGRGCGSCDLCCTIMAVDMAPMSLPAKPDRVKCQFCKNGCTVYESKPDSCSSFLCLWLAMQAFPDGLSRDLRPDKSGVVIDVNSEGNIVAHSQYDDSWKKQSMLAMLLDLAARLNVIIERPNGNLWLHPDGKTEELIQCGISPETGNLMFRTKGFPFND